MKEISPVQNWLLIAIFVAGSGVLYDMLFMSGTPIVGAIFALFIGMPILAYEREVLFRGLYRRIQKLGTFAFILAELVVYIVIMNVGFTLAGMLTRGLGFLPSASWTDFVGLPFDVFLYSLAICSTVIFFLRVRELLGRDIFVSMLMNRYRNPVNEDRIFLFIDLADSTAFAEKFGDLRAQEYLSSLFSTFAEPVRRHKGAIDDYVGDAAIITWPLSKGARDGRCVRCVFDILDEIEANAESWQRNYGQVPRLRAALHGGSIITAEIGVDHHKITYFGDTVNTTARLESLCRTLGRPVLISAELAQRIRLPENIQAEDLGSHAVKGRGQTLGVVALTSSSPKIRARSRARLS